MNIKENCLMEIYMGSNDSFSVGRFISTIENYFLFKLVDYTGRVDGVYLVRNDFIKGIKYNTKYLKKMRLSINFWENLEPRKFEKTYGFLNFEDVLVYIKNKDIVSSFKLPNSEFLTTGYIDAIDDEFITVEEIEVDTGERLCYQKIVKKDIVLIEMDSVENRVLDYVVKSLL